MEFVALKRNRGRKKRRHLKKRRCEHIKFEVKSMKHQRFLSECTDMFTSKEKFTSNTKQANSFWENYTAAQEWQKRHSVTWWRTRCFALEYENQVLRDKLRSLARQNAQQCSSHSWRSQGYKNQDAREEDEEEEEEDRTETTVENETLEFQVNEDMMNFLEQSIRHKIELKKKREAEESVKEEEKNKDICIQGGAAWVQARNKSAKLLYGDGSSTILAMETALQTTIDRHKDKAKPQYWPVIPLKS
ncbi:gem-associated protein 8-like [Colletes gigas]|uniref:gem-associated protein 8-like n=1 Tax=Colletes gigas TaxID=935657 RepID=UPI001C9BAA1C|nr:gem-associated protein 8-like [Colletes gigas]